MPEYAPFDLPEPDPQALAGLPHLRCFQPAPGLWAWYDGRVPGYRAYPQPNWIDEGALAVGIASFALVAGDEALVYDPHTSVTHGARVRADLDTMGVRRYRVVLSHRHMDHIAGTAAFAGFPVIANAVTAAHLARDRAEIETGSLRGAPPIAPLILPDTVFDSRLAFDFGGRRVELLHFDIHSDDGTVLWLPDERLLLAGDTLEDPITYLAEPGRLAAHLVDLHRLADLKPRRILPNHADPDRLAAGGFGPGLIDATIRYVTFLTELKDNPGRADWPLEQVIADDLAAGIVVWHPSYVEVHRDNVRAVLEAA